MLKHWSLRSQKITDVIFLLLAEIWIYLHGISRISFPYIAVSSPAYNSVLASR
jgi:hypothetical protein